MTIEIRDNGTDPLPFWLKFVDAAKFVSPFVVRHVRPAPTFKFRIVCVSGVLCTGTSSDFLICILNAREAKKRISNLFTDPHHSSLRVQFFYPNRKRVPREHVTASLAALDAFVPDTNLGCPTRANLRQLVAARHIPATLISSACSDAVGMPLVVGVDVDFSQAGVVAPPESPDFGISSISSSVGLGAVL